MKAGAGFVIVPAVSPRDIEAARALFQEYAAGLSVDLCFQNFAEELATLPGNYSPPTGCLLLAKAAGRNIGCIAVRQLEPQVAELKRLYLQPSFRDRGIGKALVQHALAFAREAGYCVIRLDTLREMKSAIALYTACGFKEISPYNAGGPESIQFFELKLSP